MKNRRRLKEVIKRFVLQAPVWNAIFAPFFKEGKEGSKGLHSFTYLMRLILEVRGTHFSPSCPETLWQIKEVCPQWVAEEPVEGGYLEEGWDFEKIVVCSTQHKLRGRRRSASRNWEDEWQGREYKELTHKPFHRPPRNCPFVLCLQPTKSPAGLSGNRLLNSLSFFWFVELVNQRGSRFILCLWRSFITWLSGPG